MVSVVKRGWETSSSTRMESQEPSHLKNSIKEDHVYGMMVSKIPDIRWGQECLRQGETKWALRFLQLTAWRHGRDPGEPRRLGVEDWSWEGDRGVWSSQHRWPEERPARREPWSCAERPLCTLNSQCTCQGKLPEAGKEAPERIRGYSTKCTENWE